VKLSLLVSLLGTVYDKVLNPTEMTFSKCPLFLSFTCVYSRFQSYAKCGDFNVKASGIYGRAVAQRLDAGFPPRRPGFAYGQHVGFVVDKAALGQVFSEFPLPIIPPISPLS
jgi:hypothetical protein